MTTRAAGHSSPVLPLRMRLRALGFAVALMLELLALVTLVWLPDMRFQTPPGLGACGLLLLAPVALVKCWDDAEDYCTLTIMRARGATGGLTLAGLILICVGCLTGLIAFPVGSASAVFGAVALIALGLGVVVCCDQWQSWSLYHRRDSA